MPDTSHLPERRKLAARLKAAREATGLSGSGFAGELGWPQSRVSRIETGAVFPSPEHIRAWAAVTHADAGALLALRERARAEHAARNSPGTAAGRQAKIGRFERACGTVEKFQPVVIPSQLRTRRYAAEYLRLPSGPLGCGQDEASVDAVVAAQMRRHQILYEPEPFFRIVILEAALHTRLVSPATMAGQLDRLLAVTLGGLPSTDFRIIPASRLVPVFPVSGFVIFDERLVSVENLTGEQRISEPGKVREFTRAFGLLHAAGVGGRQAGALIRSALARLGADPAAPAPAQGA